MFVRHAVLVLACAAMASGAAGAQVDHRAEVRARRANFGATLTWYKVINSQLKQRSPNIPAVREAADRMAALLAQLPAWFPAGSGPEAGAETNAKPEIWTNPAGFRERSAAMVAAAERLRAAAQGGNPAEMRAELHAASAACDACHRTFEERF